MNLFLSYELGVLGLHRYYKCKIQNTKFKISERLRVDYKALRSLKIASQTLDFEF